MYKRQKRWKSSHKFLWFLTTVGIFWSLIFFKNSTINFVDKSCTNIGHALPNALLPIVTISGLTMASLAGGALLFEVTFSWPGIALRLHEAISQRDYTLVQGIVIFTSILIVTLNLFVDILIAYLDPRIEY